MELNDHRLHRRRADAYRLLSACFYPPERRLLLEENLCANLETLLTWLCPAAAAAALEMGSALRNMDGDSLLVAHAALFVGPFELLAPPYGSVYLEKTRLLMGDSTLETRRFYEDACLSLDIHEAPDHIAIELEFAGYLAGQASRHIQDGEQDKAAAGLAMHARFLNRLLARWAPLLAEAIRRNAKDSFYLALADCLEHFIRCEQELLGQPDIQTVAA